MFRFVLKNRLFIHYLTLIIVILGIYSLFNLQREARPNVNFNRVAIAAIYPGASPQDIEELVIDPLEEKIAEVDGVEEYRSVSFSGAGSISVKIDDEYPDPEKVVDELRRKISQVSDLPSQVKDPIITEIKAENIPVLRLALYGPLSPFEMKIEIEKLRDFLRTFSGVQSINSTGLADLQFKILTHPEKLNQYDVTLVEIYNQLKSRLRQRPGGLMESETETANIIVGDNLDEIEKLNEFTIRSNDSGRKVQLSDLADITLDTERSQQSTIFGEQNAILLTIVKKPFADAVSTVDEIKLGLKEYAKNLPSELKYKLYTDESVRVRDRLKIVGQNAGFGLILVIIILMIFLDWRSSVVVSIGIPVALLGGLFLVYLLGSTMNSLVIIGIIIVLGMLVDDAIVVCENIYSYIEAGHSAEDATIKGVSEIAVPVVATVLTTIFAFLPILFMKEIMGQFLRVIPLTVIAMLSVSLFEALVILPVHAKEIMKAKKNKKNPFARVENAYRKYLEWSIRHKYMVLLAIIGILIVSIFQGKILFQKFTMFPARGLQGMSIRLEQAKNTPIKKTSRNLKKLSQILQSVSRNSFDSIYSNAGSVSTGGSGGSRQSGSHLGQITIVFVSDSSFANIEQEVVSKIKSEVKKFSEDNSVKTSITINRPGPPIGKPIQFQIAARDFDTGSKIVDQLKQALAKIDGVHSLETDLDGDNTSYRYIIDTELAISEGVDNQDISRTIFSASTGTVVGEVLKNNEKVEILLGLSQSKDIISSEKILKLSVRNANRQSVPIGIFTKAVVEKGPSSIQRLDGSRTITLFGEVDDKVITGKEANVKIRPLIAKLRLQNPAVKIRIGGGEKNRMAALKDTGRLYIFALILIFMVISLSFQSVIYPFLVLLTVPMGLCGVVWSLAAHSQPLSLMSLVGIVGLSGVVVNVSIILLKFIQERVRAGMNYHQAIVEAGVRRLRPIVITTVTTLIGLLPTIYGIGGMDFFVQPLALVLGWGLFVATALTLLTLPAVISILPMGKK